MTTTLAARFRQIRATTEQLASALSPEDQLLQATPMASPTKWHRAHTAWFFEAFVLEPAGVPPVHPGYAFLFNSYYDTVGARLARPKRTLLSRPSATEITAYRHEVDARVLALIERGDAPIDVIELGLQHEQQHQELILTDILHAFSENPIGPVYRPPTPDEPLPSADAPGDPAAALGWSSFEGGVVEIGATGSAFAYDNEGPRHRVYLQPFALANRPISVGEVRAFIHDGGYHTPSLWLVDGFALARAEGWQRPLHWRDNAGSLEIFTLRGWRAPAEHEPASHLSFWEADAVARYLGGRLPTEAEWEHAAQDVDPSRGNYADGDLVPKAARALWGDQRGPGPCLQLFGDVWEWTRSSYEPYPGYRPAAGALGEYNGKFMAQQVVLRGGSCLSPRGHLRASYRNFWPPETRFQMAGARMARDA